MPAKGRERTKADSLREEGMLNSAAKLVNDAKFFDGEFFDPRDVVQVKYEMLRRVFVDNLSVTKAAEEYGISRPTYYQTKASFDESGIVGLLPKKRGPRGPHKINDDILSFIKKQVTPGQPMRARSLAILIQKKFNLDLHPRTIERALREKKTPK